MNGINISIVIAVYNIETYIENCIKSVIEQDFEGFDVILIDDGSTDGSGKICDKYAEKYENVYVYHKENGGLSDARNFGLQKAKGKYVLFTDGDDMLFRHSCASLYKDAEKENADIVIGKARLSKPLKSMERFESVAQKNFEMHKAYTGSEYLSGCLKGGALRVDVWRNLYRRDFLLKNNLFFKFGVAHEDEEFTPRTLLTAKKVVLTDEEVYYYNNDRAGSIMNTKNIKKELDRIEIYKELLEIYKTVKPRKLRRLLEDDISWKYMDCCKNMGVGNCEIQRLLPIKCAFNLKRRIKAYIFAISPKMYIKYF